MDAMPPPTVVAGHDAETGAGFSEDFAFPLFAKDPNGLQLHLVERDLTANFRNGQVHTITRDIRTYRRTNRQLNERQHSHSWRQSRALWV
jgi:hypothetical protein